MVEVAWYIIIRTVYLEIIYLLNVNIFVTDHMFVTDHSPICMTFGKFGMYYCVRDIKKFLIQLFSIKIDLIRTRVYIFAIAVDIDFILLASESRFSIFVEVDKYVLP